MEGGNGGLSGSDRSRRVRRARRLRLTLLAGAAIGLIPTLVGAARVIPGSAAEDRAALAVTSSTAPSAAAVANPAASAVPRQEETESAGLGVAQGEHREAFWLRALRGLLGLGFLIFMAFLFSANRKAIDWALVGKGVTLQIVFALLVLRTGWGRGFFHLVNDVFIALIGYTKQGAGFLFGSLVERSTEVSGGGGGAVEIGADFAFSTLPTIIFFSSLMTILYYIGVMQIIVKGMAWAMQKTLGTSGAETVSAAGNIFVGQTEDTLLIKPFVKNMTMSELNTVMTGGFATVAGGVMAAYVGMLAVYFPQIAGHLLAASIMAAPAGIVISKMLMPETEEPKTKGSLKVELEQPHVNVIDAASAGASDGLKLALNVGAMLLAFLALIALGNGLLGWATGLVGVEGITLERLFGWLFSPVAWLIGVPLADAVEIGSLFGIKMAANEFIAFQTLADTLSAASQLNYKSVIIATYALTGFANFSSIAIQIGGVGGIAPSRRHDLSKLGIRAMLGGTAATWMTATLAGVLV